MLKAARTGPSAFAHPLLRLPRAFCRNRSGVSAVEFALLAPVLVALMGGAVEFSGAITASNRATYVADALAEMVSRTDHALSPTELKNFAVASALVNPDIVKFARLANVDIENAFKVTISSVQFDKASGSGPTCTNNCVYTARTVFSYSLNGTARACGNLSASNGQSFSTGNLPADVYGPGSLVVVDIDVSYKPVMPIRLAPTLSFKRSSYFRPRYVSRVDSTSNCPGF